MKREFSRRLRRDQTDAERKLWRALRDRSFHGSKFRRQQPIGPYVVDFVCFDAKLIVELDGSQHGTPEELIKDAARSDRLGKDGFRVRRFWNHEMTENFDGVLEQIWRDLGSPEPPMTVAADTRPIRARRLFRKKT